MIYLEIIIKKISPSGTFEINYPYRPTQVHRFIIRGTIEEKMYRMLKSAEATASSHVTEENCLTVGDLTSLLKEEREEEQGGSSQDI